MVDDDRDDRFLTQRAWNSLGIDNDCMEFSDGEAFLEYMASDQGSQGRPRLVLLDLNMPRVDGWQVLDALKSSPETKAIPVVVLTTSRREADVATSYRRGAAAFVSKPDTMNEWSQLMESIADFWIESCTLP